MKINLPGIQLQIKQSMDSNYPGFRILFNGVEVALAEYDIFSSHFNVHVWEQDGVWTKEEPVTFRYATDLGKEKEDDGL